MFYKAIENALAEKLQKRKIRQTFRQLPKSTELIDFSSNDYLGFVADSLLKIDPASAASGATASRLIAGNTPKHEQLEQEIADFHGAQSGLLFNSGYDANVGLLGCIAQKGDLILYDELSHASIRDGLKMSLATARSFPHNDETALETALQETTGNIFVVTDGIFSMDGDRAPLEKILNCCQKHGAALIIDEAHSNGVIGPQGRGLVSALGMEEKVFARVHTFGKALGCHGAIILGSKTLRDYLINYARSFIFTTAMAPHNLLFIEQAYQVLKQTDRIKLLSEKIKIFRQQLSPAAAKRIVAKESPIQSIIIGGAEETRILASKIQKEGLDVKPIVAPTVAAGSERIRICIHANNKEADLIKLADFLNEQLGSLNQE